jgi:nucleoside-diphosphate-sugar epimerase
MKVLLTGATGFVGSHVARLLVQQGCEVHALVREGSDARRIADIGSRLILVRGDVCSTDPARLARQVNPELCIHAAWYAKPGEYLRSQENVALQHATLRLALALAENGCRRFLGVGTCFEYDTAQGYLSETSRIGPNHLYSACKAGTALALQEIGRLTTMSVVWARLFYLYGPHEDNQRLVPSVMRALIEGRTAKVTPGAQVRDFLHVEDVAAALWAVAKSSATGAVNIGSGTPVTVRDVVGCIGDILGRRELVELGAIPYGQGDPMFVCANNTRLVHECGWSQRFQLGEGLRHTVAWWRRALEQPAAAEVRS